MATTEIYRFMFVRPPVLKTRKELASRTIKYTLTKTNLFKKLEGFKTNLELDKIVFTAQNALRSAEVYQHISEIQKVFTQEESLIERIRTETDANQFNDIKSSLLQRRTVVNKISRLWDTLIVHTILGNPESIIQSIMDLIRLRNVIEAAEKSKVNSILDMRYILDYMVELPVDLFPITAPKPHVNIQDTPLVFDELDIQEDIVSQLNLLNKARKSLVKIFSNKMKSGRSQVQSFDDFKNLVQTQKVDIETTLPNIRTLEEEKSISQIGISDIDVEKHYAKSMKQRDAFLLTDADQSKLKPDIKAGLEKFQISIENQDLPTLINEIDHTISELSSQLRVQPAYRSAFIDRGILYDFATVPDKLTPCINGDTGLSYCDLLRKLQREDPQKPIVNILGIGEYKVIREKLLRYEAGEIANIKNVFAGEIFKSSIRNLTKVQEVTESETERETKQDNEASSTDRFELSKSIQEESEKANKLEFGLSASGDYGQVSFSSNASFSSSGSSKKETKSASALAKETTVKASNSVREKVREIRTKLTLNETETIHSYELNNNGPNHKVGIYFWVDKYYKHQLFNLGKRLMLEFYIPRPMEFFIFSRKSAGKKGITLINPVNPQNHMINGESLKSHQNLNRTNYHLWANAYNVKDYPLPPEEFLDRQYGISLTGSGVVSGWLKKIDDIPRGYAIEGGEFFAQTAWGHWIKSMTTGQYYDTSWPPTMGQIMTLVVPKIQEEIEFSGMSGGPGYVHIHLRCKLTENGYDQWRKDVYTSILESYESMKADYDNQLASAQIQGGIEITGNNPGMNRKTEQEELQKWCTEALLLDRFTSWDAMKKAVTGEPEIDFNKVKSDMPVVSFMNLAFDWANMTYKFLPYFYSNKAEHVTIREISDVDPKFMAALRAGYARVIVPVTYGFQDAVSHFLQTGQVWKGGSLPVLGDPLFQSIVDTIYGEEYDNLGTPEDEWETCVPTSLVWLQNNQPDGMLPTI